MDTRTSAQRRHIMQSVGSKNTKPEIAVRRILFRMGYRYRLHGADLPGRPDIVLSRYRAAILVNGCFWHGHRCQHGRLPKSNVSYWRTKITKNKERDKIVKRKLKQSGWQVHEVWECELSDERKVASKLKALLR